MEGLMLISAIAKIGGVALIIVAVMIARYRLNEKD